MTPEQIELARHALGLTNGRRVSYRNHFVTGEGHSDHHNWTAMVGNGWAKRRAGSPLSGGDDIFWLTLDGAKLALKKGERLDPEDFPSRKLSQWPRDQFHDPNATTCPNHSWNWLSAALSFYSATFSTGTLR